ncbi:MAG: hypothetical protein DRJ10_20980 [Bacteroidetes bacterium]|nr:MAG: hypothetical protein DRJ10_20980 [Bacteroidota bacterium]
MSIKADGIFTHNCF